MTALYVSLAKPLMSTVGFCSFHLTRFCLPIAERKNEEYIPDHFRTSKDKSCKEMLRGGQKMFDHSHTGSCCWQKHLESIEGMLLETRCQPTVMLPWRLAAAPCTQQIAGAHSWCAPSWGIDHKISPRSWSCHQWSIITVQVLFFVKVVFSCFFS